MEADVRLARDRQRLAEQRQGLGVAVPVQGDLGAALERERLSGRGPDRAVQLGPAREVLLGWSSLPASSLASPRIVTAKARPRAAPRRSASRSSEVANPITSS